MNSNEIHRIVIYTAPSSEGMASLWDGYMVELSSGSYESALKIADQGLNCHGKLLAWASSHQVEVNKMTPKSDSEMWRLCEKRFSPHKWVLHYHTSPMGIKYWVVVVSIQFS